MHDIFTYLCLFLLIIFGIKLNFGKSISKESMRMSEESKKELEEIKKDEKDIIK